MNNSFTEINHNSTSLKKTTCNIKYSVSYKITNALMTTVIILEATYW